MPKQRSVHARSSALACLRAAQKTATHRSLRSINWQPSAVGRHKSLSYPCGLIAEAAGLCIAAPSATLTSRDNRDRYQRKPIAQPAISYDFANRSWGGSRHCSHCELGGNFGLCPYSPNHALTWAVETVSIGGLNLGSVPMRIKHQGMGRYARTRLTVMRQSKSQDVDKYSVGGREKRSTRVVPSLPTLKCLQRDEGGKEIGDVPILGDRQ